MAIIGYGLCILNYARCLSMQEKYNEAIEMIDKACKYYYIFPKLYNELKPLFQPFPLSFFLPDKDGVQFLHQLFLPLRQDDRQ